MKKIKKPPKREIEINKEISRPPVKKVKMSNGIPKNNNEEADGKPAKGNIGLMNTTIFAFFKELTNAVAEKRINAVFQLVQQVNKTQDAEKRQKELNYTLKRLIRGCGASSNSSRCGFFSGLVLFLKHFSISDIPMKLLIEIMDKELHVGSQITNKEDANAVVGKILTCGAILRSGRLNEIEDEHLAKIINVLLQATKYRVYHASLAYTFLIEIMQKLPEEKFVAIMWPTLQKELTVPWPKQTIQTVHCLIEIQRLYPKLVTRNFLKLHLEGSELLNSNSYEYLHKMFWDHSNINVITHPAMEQFAIYIAQCKKLKEFWVNVVDPNLKTITKPLEIESLKIITDILRNLDISKTNVADLLSSNFMQMVLNGLKNNKSKKDKTLIAFYDELWEALIESCEKIKTDGKRVDVIRRLIQHPGTFNIENYTSSRIVHKLINMLSEADVKEIFELYKDVFVGKAVKNPQDLNEQWPHYERSNAGFMLQHLVTHKSVKNAYDWREEQLKFLLTCGIFSVDNDLEICKKELASDFSKTFNNQCTTMFFASVQIKVNDLLREKELLLNLVNYCNSHLQQKKSRKSIIIKNCNEESLKSWNLMMDALMTNNDKVSEPRKQSKNDNLELVFQLLLLHMGLQLFREPEMAHEAINDLLKCIQRTKSQQQLNSKTTSNARGSNDEPEWIEVVVDLFLHLLSQNTNALRNIVNVLFPHFCSSMNLSAVHAILSMLDMANGQNPLTAKDEEDMDVSENDDESDEEVKSGLNGDVEGASSNDEEEEDGGSSNEEADTEDDDDDDDDDYDDDDDDDEEENDDSDDITVTDKLRNAVSQALMSTGAAGTIDDDMESIDLNDITEEEGRKLDEALASAFKAMKGTGGIGGANKKSKKDRVQKITVMHFRIRVLDLVEIYIEHNTSSMIAIEILLALYDMLRFCNSPELQPLQNRVERVINKLVENKSYKIDADLTIDNFVSFMRTIIEKETPALSFDVMNRVRNKCIAILILQADKLIQVTGKSNPIISLWQEYIEEYIKSRNPPVNNTLLQAIFKLRWEQLWKLAVTLVNKGLKPDVRPIRRIQINEILSTLYRNGALQQLNLETAKKELKVIDEGIHSHISNIHSNHCLKRSSREIQKLFQLLIDANKTHKRLNDNSVLSTKETINEMQEIRAKIKLDSMLEYKRYCAIFKLPVIRNIDITKIENGQDNIVGRSEEAEDNNETLTDHGNTKKINKNKLKKLKKQQQIEAASKGLNGGLEFGQQLAETEDSGSDS